MLKLKGKNIEFPERYPNVIRKKPTITEEGFVTINGKKLRDGIDIMPQAGMQEAMQVVDVDILFLGGQAGGGKLIACNSGVYTPFGFKKCTDLKVGMNINNPDGTVQQIIQIKPWVTLEKWTVNFDDGTKLEVAEDHLWNAWRGHQVRKVGNKRIGGSKSAQVVETAQLKDWLERGYNPQIPVCEEQPFNMNLIRENDIDPYMLGVLLGDGCITRAEGISLAAASFDKPHYMEQFKNYTGLNYDIKDGKTIAFNGEFKKYIAERLDVYKLLGTRSDTKFIPKKYKLSSIKNRYAILQGLMDTDGHSCEGKAQCEYVSVSERLANDVAFIARSLGAIVSIKTKIGSYRDVDGVKIICKKAYRVYIKHPTPNKLFRMTRKHSDFLPQNMSKSVKSVDVGGEITGRCITVNNPNGLYVTDDFIVTHNSFGILQSALDGIEKKGYGALIIKKELTSTKDTAGGIIQDAKNIYLPFGNCEYTSSDSPTFKFGAWGTNISFTHSNFSGNSEKSIREAQEKAKNIQCAHIFFDELTDFDFKIWAYWLSRNRDSSGVPSKMICTFNTNSHHFTRTMIDWYIDDNGKVREDRIGKIRYFKRSGDSERDIVWGDTKQEVIKKCNIKVTDDLKAIGMVEEDLIKSFTFMPCKMAQNRILMHATKGAHAANLFNLGEEETQKLFYENWNAESEGDAMVSKTMIRELFKNPTDDDDERFATLDVSEGGDMTPMPIWEGNTIIAIEEFDYDGADKREWYKKLVEWIEMMLRKYDVPESNFAFDATGLGSYLKSYTNGRPVTMNMAMIPEVDVAGNAVKTELFYNIRSQLMGKAQFMIETGMISIKVDPRKMFKSGKTKKELVEILEGERDVFRKTKKGNKTYFVQKLEYKHKYNSSPDIMDSIILKAIFLIDSKPRKERKVEFTQEDYYAQLNT